MRPSDPVHARAGGCAAWRRRATRPIVLAACLLAACGRNAPPSATDAQVTPAVLKANAAVAQAADLSDPPSFADAQRGFIAAPQGQVRNDAGEVVWDYDAFAFVKGAAPATVWPERVVSARP